MLAQAIEPPEYLRRLRGIGSILSRCNNNTFRLFTSWLKIVSSADLPEQTKQEIIRIIDESTPEEAEKMISNMERTLGNLYEKGLEAGKMDAAKKMLAENLSEDLIVKVTGLPVEQIRKIKSELH